MKKQLHYRKKKMNSYLIKSVILFFIFFQSHTTTQAQCEFLYLTTQAEVDAFSCGVVSGGFIISGSSITNIDALNSLEVIIGGLTIEDTGITNLNALSMLSVITEDLNIINNSQLDQFEDFCGLHTVLTNSGIYGYNVSGNGINPDQSAIINGGQCSGGGGGQNNACNNASLTLSTQAQVDAFSCTTFTGNLKIEGAITNINALSSLTSVTGYLKINNTDVTNLNGFAALTSVGGEFEIKFNNNLSDLSGLSSLTSIGGELDMVADSYSNLDGFAALTSIGGDLSLNLSSNNNLSNLDGFVALTSIGGDLWVIHASGLNDLGDFCGLHTVLNTSNGLTGSYNVFGNSYNPSQTAIISAGSCTSQLLPVELTNFNASAINEKEIQLTWQTASELNNMGFQVETSINGTDWEMINFTQGNGTTTATQNYTYLDTRPIIGHNYYRLKQMDFDGKFEYSDIRTVLIGSPTKATLQVFPNPNDGQFTLNLLKPAKSDASIRVYGSEGNLIFQKYVKPTEELGNWKEELNLPAGKMYYVVAYVGDEVITEKIISRSKR